jgi:hypothetical protein
MRPIIFGMCMFAGACSGQVLDSPTSPSTATVAPGRTQAPGAVQLPFRGTFTGEDRGVLNCPPTCPPTTLRVTGKDTGEATHLGHFTAIYEDVVYIPATTGTGTLTFTAANGDELFTTYEGGQTEFVPPDLSTLTLVATITGGTGRFAAATGTFTIIRILVVNFATGIGTESGSFEGQISLNK